MALPTINEIEATEGKLGSALSDLDDFKSRVQKLAEPVPIEDYAFLLRTGASFPDEPVDVDEATLLRLLAFAVELQADAEALLQDAAALRDGALRLYREEMRERG
jgi:hypothetical protein